MLFLIGFFAWFSLKQAYENDDRMARGEPPAEKLETDEKVWCWPDLVYTELIALLVASIVLLVWAILIEAPLEEPASITVAPNPSKAPWYFLGLQEMLVYFDPWLAGVVFPSLIILGLMALPYIDTNPKGNGYYTFRERAREIALFLFGFLVLWVFMIMTGTFLRGPNWNFFGPYEYWDPHKLVPLNNINFSEFIWVRWLGTGLPQQWLAREIFGILVVLAYFLALPPLLARRWLNDIHRKMGAARYAVGIVLILSMIALPIKMYLRWIFNLKYIIAIPEFFFNI
ncbi:MAG: cytochrome C [Acidobacteria bacterium]|nr:cytochrome C [Acidobacteriota bacterium]